MKVGVLDIGAGNLFSILSTLEKLNIDVIKVSNSKNIQTCDILIMPGVGAFNTYMYALNGKGLGESIKEFIQDKNKKLLAICVGMQVLFEFGKENETVKGLNIFEGYTDKNINGLNIGYKRIQLQSKLKKSSLEKALSKGKFYFTHGYHIKTNDQFETVSFSQNQEERYYAFLKKGNIYGCQFHPELSGEIGMKLLISIFNFS